MNQQKIIRLLVLLIVAAVVFFGGKAIWNYFVFKTIGVSPALSSITTLTPQLTISFTHAPDPSKVKISDTNYAYIDYKVVKNTLVIDLDQPLNKTLNYSITLESIGDRRGNTIQNKTYSFTPKETSYENLPKSQQQALINEQDKPMPSPETIDYSGMETLVNRGISNPQRQDLEWEFFNYKPTAKKITLATNQATQTRNTNGAGFVMTIPTIIDGKSYTSTVMYWGLTHVNLRITPQGGQPVLITQTLHSTTPYVTTKLDKRKYPIVNKLPYVSTDGYMITFGKISGSSDPTIVVTYYRPEAKDLANEWLVQNNASASSVPIIFDQKQ